MSSRTRSSEYTHSRTRTAGAERRSPESPSDRFARLASFPFIKSQLSSEASRTLDDELTFQRAVQLYLWALPSLSIYAMKEASEREFGRGYNVLPIFRDRLDATTLVTTPSSDVICALGFLDLQEDGPLVIDVPPTLEGVLYDVRRRPLQSVGEIGDRTWAGDVGPAGPDKGNGGKYLLLPPDYAGEIPEGYLPFQSSTYGVFVSWRGFFDDPKRLDAPVHLIEQTRIYPIDRTHETAKPMALPNASGASLNMLYPHDYTAFEMLDRFIQHEYADERDLELRSQAAALGIVKGRPFVPDGRMKEILDAAAKTAWRMGHVMNVNAPCHYPDRAYSAGPSIFLGVPESGTKCLTAFVDADGDAFDGEFEYRLCLPPDIPAKLFSVTLYDPELGVELDNGQAFPAISQTDQPRTDPDGSIDIYFGPSSPGRRKNWIATLPDRGFFVMIRLYEPTHAFFENAWKPFDVVRV